MIHGQQEFGSGDYRYLRPYPFRWIPLTGVEMECQVKYMTQNYTWKNITFNYNDSDGENATWHMFDQFKSIVGMAHHRKNSQIPISYAEWKTTWPCVIFRLDQAPGGTVLVDQTNRVRFEHH